MLLDCYERERLTFQLSQVSQMSRRSLAAFLDDALWKKVVYFVHHLRKNDRKTKNDKATVDTVGGMRENGLRLYHVRV